VSSILLDARISMLATPTPLPLPTSLKPLTFPHTNTAWAGNEAAVYKHRGICKLNRSAIVDTGTTALYLPVAVASAMMSTINGQQLSDGSYIAPVRSLTTATSFSFNFNGGSISINPLDLIAGYAVCPYP
jgi:hypothetical protein